MTNLVGVKVLGGTRHFNFSIMMSSQITQVITASVGYYDMKVADVHWQMKTVTVNP